MTFSQSSTALICIDFINDIVHPDGKVAKHGNADFIARNDTLSKVEQLQTWAKNKDYLVIHVKIGFSDNYNPHPTTSPLFGSAKKNNIFVSDTWGTEFIAQLANQGNDLLIEKRRVNAFYSTPLADILRSHNISQLILCGCATDLAVQSTARDAHDRDFIVTVVSDCCVAKNEDVHNSTLQLLTRIASVTSLETILKQKI
ncbi:cysteine hydrolase family protein [Paraglaciecola polaris]|uniref:Isochorismatase-like domain-containing protein n=1 Tax=Paraglaciecola polaris LMG 21857 TaxID=1129793 RepID=K6ZDR3_9ALTE|nr:isochorismatase family cysteine hydrolase [Paraglaciecola polaris]GAC34226.1 hypothetical protein GPLA_3337 [Paraglaciecola polaris LMG 21857]|tara:strand:+ start:2141 stop:2740 length:600 start_codon:yes stop_codon:yes gene_type:complete